MSIKKISSEQPNFFKFSDENLIKIKKIINKYPVNKQTSAVMPLLYLAQKQNFNWIPLAAIKSIAKILEMPYIKVYEVATFYSMYNLSPVGKYFIQICTTTPCMIRGAYKLVNICKNKISKNSNELSLDKNSSWTEVECLGACVNAPMMQINDDFFEDLSEKDVDNIIDLIKNNKDLNPGSYKNRKSSKPESQVKNLTNNNA